MTEYATDPEAIQEFFHARDRCANWVNVHSQGMHFMSPSSPPSILSDSDAASYGPSESDTSSAHSLPPRMLLRYEDGRPDVPISHDRHSPTQSRAHPQSSRHRSRSGSLVPPAPAEMAHLAAAHHAQSLSYASGSRYAPAAQPENIRILPSRQPEDSQRVPASSSSHRSRGPPAQAIFPPHQPSIHDRVPPHADLLHTSNRSLYGSTPRHAGSPTQPIPVLASPTNSSPTRSAPGGSRFYEQPGMAASTVHAGLPYQYQPPAIVYAPSGRHGGRSNYQPPAIVYSPSSHPHRRAPAPGIAYSRSDPLPHPTQYSPPGPSAHHPYASAPGSSHHSRPRSHSTTERTTPSSRGRGPSIGRDRARTRSPTPSLSQSDTSSDTSGSTYYVLPSPGQKVQIIVSLHFLGYLTACFSATWLRRPI